MFLNESAEKLDLSARAYHRIIKLSRTIADLGDSPDIEVAHILEAFAVSPQTNLDCFAESFLHSRH